MENFNNMWADHVSLLRPTTKSELRDAIKQVFYHGIKAVDIANLVQSMPNRVQTVLDVKGSATRY